MHFHSLISLSLSFEFFVDFIILISVFTLNHVMSFLKIVCAPHFHFPISLSLSFELFCQFYPSYICSVYLKPCDVLLEEIVSHAAKVLADRLLRPHREPHLQEYFLTSPQFSDTLYIHPHTFEN